MAEGSGGAGKAIAGCSGCLVVVFLVMTILFTAGSGMIYSMTDGKVSPAELQPFQWVSSTCCCLSGAGLILGVVLLLVGGKKSPNP